MLLHRSHIRVAHPISTEQKRSKGGIFGKANQPVVRHSFSCLTIWQSLRARCVRPATDCGSFAASYNIKIFHLSITGHTCSLRASWAFLTIFLTIIRARKWSASNLPIPLLLTYDIVQYKSKSIIWHFLTSRSSDACIASNKHRCCSSEQAAETLATRALISAVG